MAAITASDREKLRQLDRFIHVFPQTWGMLKRLLDLTEPGVPHDDEEREAAAEIAADLTLMLAILAVAAGDTRPALTISAGTERPRPPDM